MRKYFQYLAIIACCFQCKKSEFNDLAGSQLLRGVAMVYDTLNGVSNIIPAKNYKVYLRYVDNPNGYLYYTNADAAGQYSFNGIDAAKSYTIYCLSDTGTVKYYGEQAYTGGNYTSNTIDSLKLYPSQKNQNGIHVRVINGQQPVPNTTVWVFNNADLFAADTSAGKVFDIPTNQFGIGNKLNIAAGTYYLRIKTRIGTNDLSGEAITQVPADGIIDAPIALSKAPLPRNGIEATVIDTYGTPVADAKVYGYRSQFIFENDTIKFNNSLFTMTSNQAGLATTYLIDPGTYYLRAVKIINSDTLTNTAIVTVTTNNISRPTPMIVK